ncbi:MAG: tyrosine-type recombinase/integrase [Ignavibacteriaceae bacterium]
MAVKVREKLKDSGEWWIFINHHGKRKSKKIGKDKKIALEVAEKIKAKLVLNELSIEKINSKCPTFKEYAEMWLSLPHERKESTQKNYRNYLRKYVYPYIGEIQIDKIGKKDFKLMFDKIAIKGLTISTCRTFRIPTSGVLDHAVDTELIEVSHLKNIKFGKNKVKYKVNPLTEEETISLLNEMLNYKDGNFYPPLLCLLRTGMRIGELQALTWNDVDIENRLIEINKTWWRGTITKTKNSKNRKVDMSRQLAEVLREVKHNLWKKYA